MAIPDFQTIMLPLLEFMGDGEEHSVVQAVDYLSRIFGLEATELNELLPSGKQPVFYNRVGWARTYLTKSCLLEMSKRPFYRITERGKKVLQTKPEGIDLRFLTQFPEYLEFR
jgi:restriction system protein